MAYGDWQRDGIVRRQPRNLTKFYMYRTPLCHQSVFFNGGVLRGGLKYDLRYGILADYNMEIHLCKNSSSIHVDAVVCDYLGGGISETEKGLAIKKNDRRGIIRSQFTGAQRFFYYLRWKLTFPKLRGLLSSSKRLSKRYFAIVNRINGR